MIKDVEQFVPSSVCLKCDGCCRFKEADSSWRPKIMDEEKEQAANQGMPDNIFSDGAVDAQGFISTLLCQGTNVCTFLDISCNKCRIYNARPFECQLYPFLVIKKGEEAIVAVHLSCPYVQDNMEKEEFAKYVDDLQMLLRRQEVIDFLKRNPSVVNDYSEYKYELKELFVIKVND